MRSTQDFMQLIQYWMIRKNKSYTIINFFYLVFETKQFCLPIFFLSISEQKWSSLYPRLTNHCFNCSRWLRFSSVEQILLNLTTCPYTIDPLYTLRCYECACRYWCVLVDLQYESVSNLLPTFVTVTPIKFISVVE